MSVYEAVAAAERIPSHLASSYRLPVKTAQGGASLASEVALDYIDDHFEKTDENGVVHKFFGPVSNIAISAKGALGSIKCAETLKSALSGATVTATALFPAKVRQIGVAVYVTTLVAGPTSFDVGDGSDADRYANDLALAAGTQSSFSDATADPGGWSATAGDVVLTGVGGSFSAGAVRICAFYMDYVGPTS